MSGKITHKVCSIIISLKTRSRRAVGLGNIKKDIVTPKVVKVIGKSAQGVQNGLRIPAAFKLKPLPLRRAAPQHFMYIDRETHILRSPLVALRFTQISQIPTGTYNTPVSANPLLEWVTCFSMDVSEVFLLDINL
jgi:hypothetical protein